MVVCIKKKTSWDTFEFQKEIKTFICCICLFLAWNSIFYEYNFFFDEAHYLDRLLIFLCLFGVWKSPIFLPLFLGLVLTSLAQFSYPLGIDKKIIYEILILFLAVCIVKPFFKKDTTIAFFVIMFALIAANYFTPALSKIAISPNYTNWLFENELWVHHLHSVEKGWLSFIPNRIRSQIGIFFFEFNSYLIATVTTHVGCTRFKVVLAKN